MIPCIIGIGGSGGKILKVFLRNQDVELLGNSFGEHIAFGGVKGIWIDAATNECEEDKFFKGRLEKGYYPGFIIPGEVLMEDSGIKTYLWDTYRYDLRRFGFNRSADYIKAIFEILHTDEKAKEKVKNEFNVDENPLLAYIWSEGIYKFTHLAQVARKSDESSETNLDNDENKLRVCDSLLFIASLGGGTGTGFVNPITSYVRSKGSIFITALCILTETGIDSRKTPEEQRDLGAVIAMYDLLTKERGRGIDGLILIDNQSLQNKYGFGNYSAINEAIFDAMKPFIEDRSFPDVKGQTDSLAIQDKFLKRLEFPGIFTVCYAHSDISKCSEEGLVKDALTRGRLFPCNPNEADRAYVFTRGFLDSSRIRKAVHDHTGLHEDESEGKILVYRKFGERSSAEALILLRNPYGKEMLDFSRDTCGSKCKNEDVWKHIASENFNQRIYCLICKALTYLDTSEHEIITAGYPSVTKVALGKYLFGEAWIEKKLKELNEKVDLKKDESEFKKMLEEEKTKLDRTVKKPAFLENELKNVMYRLENLLLEDDGKKLPIFIRPLNIFDYDEGEQNIEETKIRNMEIDRPKSEINGIIRTELKSLLKSDEYKQIIKDILKSFDQD